MPRTAGISGKFNLLGATNNKLYTSSAFVEGGVTGLPSFGRRIQGTFKKAGDAQAPNYRLTNTGMEEQNFSIGLGYHQDDLGAKLFYSSFDTEIGFLGLRISVTQQIWKKPSVRKDYSLSQILVTILIIHTKQYVMSY